MEEIEVDTFYDNGVLMVRYPDGATARLADVYRQAFPGREFDDMTGMEVAMPPPSPGGAAAPRREHQFGDVGGATLSRAIDDVKAVAGMGGEATRSMLPDDWQQTFPDWALAAGDYGLAGMTGLLGAVETGAGYAGDAVETIQRATGLGSRYAPGGSAKALQRDLMGMFDAAGALPEGRMVAAITDAARPAIRQGVMDFAADEFGGVSLPPLSNAQRTQIAGTFPTYQKALGVLDTVVPEGRALDFGAGLGMSRDLGFDTFEPFPRAGFDPTYRSASDIPDASYDRLTNLNVLNVVPREIRDGIVEDIGRVIRPGGAGVITTRGRDVLNAKGMAGPEPMSVITSVDTYQKGFTQSELQDYLRYMLGKNFDVSPLRLGPAGALIQRNR